jgi:hypothetical protein
MQASTPSTPTPAQPPLARLAAALLRLMRRITPLEWTLAALAALVLLVLVIAEPAILEAPFENERTLLFTFGGTAVAAVVAVAMLLRGVPSPVRVVVLGLPFVLVNWWLLSPFFLDDVVDDDFAVTIDEARGETPSGGGAPPASP